MKLRTISEIQHKFVTTNMNRSGTCGVYAANSVNHLFHAIYGRPSHIVNGAGKPRTTNVSVTSKQKVLQRFQSLARDVLEGMIALHSTILAENKTGPTWPVEWSDRMFQDQKFKTWLMY